VTGVEKEEPLREIAEGCFVLGVRRGLVPPSCVFVGIVQVLDEVSEPASDGGAGEGQSESATSFRLRFRIIWFDTVAACNFGIVSFAAQASAWRAVNYDEVVDDNLSTASRFSRASVTCIIKGD
jgi:hypothetical protein